jgi:hypothetical protein
MAVRALNRLPEFACQIFAPVFLCYLRGLLCALRPMHVYGINPPEIQESRIYTLLYPFIPHSPGSYTPAYTPDLPQRIPLIYPGHAPVTGQRHSVCLGSRGSIPETADFRKLCTFATVIMQSSIKNRIRDAKASSALFNRSTMALLPSASNKN